MDFFASCVEGMAQIWDLIVERKFNEGIARMVTSLDWCGLDKDIKFICNIHAPPSSQHFKGVEGCVEVLGWD
jgi:hypothetical protein